MKKDIGQRLLGVAAAAALLLTLTACGAYTAGTLTGLVVTYGGDPHMFELQGDDGSNYGFVITDATELVWEDDSAFSIWSGRDTNDWDVFSCNMYVTVVPGEETESADAYVDECVTGWYFAEKVTVTKVDEGYFATDEKPVIYLYPEEATKVTVTLDYSGALTCTYPAYDNGWTVLARPDGTLTNLADGKEYSYLYWEGVSDAQYDRSRGFVVKGEDTAEFLQETLAGMGLTPKEYNEFIVYWLPKMQDNPYNLITFQSECYTDRAVLNISPQPDSVLRVFMAWQALEEPVEVEPQEFTSFQREGFTVVEWGGTELR